MTWFARTYRSPASVLVVLGTVLCFTSAATANAPQASPKGDPEAAKIKNPVAATPESIASGKTTFATMCAACHGEAGKGGITLSVIEDKGGTQPPALADDKWDHGSSDGEIFTVVKKGVAPDFFMTPFDGRISDTDIWNTVNYLKSLSPKK